MTMEMRRQQSGNLANDDNVLARTFPTAEDMGFADEPFRKGKLSVTILGASGDLSKKETYPALLDLYAHGYIPKHTAIVGFARTKQDSKQFQDWLRPWLEKSSAGQMPEVKGKIDEFLSKCLYFAGDYGSTESFAELSKLLTTEEDKAGSSFTVTNRVFYFAIPPFAFLKAAQSIKASAMAPGEGFTRLLVEKPFGSDLASAQNLAHDLGILYPEKDLFRMDHFLGYEICQNILFMRYGNAFLDPLMNNKYVASVRVSLKEDFGTEGRGGYFTQYGIIRDVMQNHLLQMMTLVAMDKPSNIGGDIRDAKVALLNAVMDIDPDEVVLGQFTAGNGKPGFTEDDSIKKEDAEQAKWCSTFAQLVIRIDNDRWRGVPFIIRAGKGLEESKCEVRVQFKENHSDSQIFKGQTCPRNELVMRVSPKEAVYLRMNIKSPGLSMKISQSELDLSYDKRYAGVYSPQAYTRLILAGIRGESKSFVRNDELIRSWELFSPLLEKIEGGKKELIKYPFGSRGPPQADAALANLNFVRATDYVWPGEERAEKRLRVK
jgi:glucose-6-phosphate 1-dehydrogenase